MTNAVKVVSMNCQGLADPRKRRDVFHYLREKSYSIYLGAGIAQWLERRTRD